MQIPGPHLQCIELESLILIAQSGGELLLCCIWMMVVMDHRWNAQQEVNTPQRMAFIPVPPSRSLP